MFVGGLDHIVGTDKKRKKTNNKEVPIVGLEELGPFLSSNPRFLSASVCE